jgi:hypothetical protein
VEAKEHIVNIDLDAITEKWLHVCGPCDLSVPGGCTHPGDDYRPVMLELVREIDRLRAELLVEKADLIQARADSDGYRRYGADVRRAGVRPAGQDRRRR